jgi:hypothetical protein
MHIRSVTPRTTAGVTRGPASVEGELDIALAAPDVTGLAAPERAAVPAR